MENADIIALRKQLLADPETGVAAKRVADLSQEDYLAVKPFIEGEMEWPAEPVDADETVAEPPADDTPPAAGDEPAAEPPAAVTREVVVAKSTVERAAARKTKYAGLIAAEDAILAEPEPDYDLDESGWRVWNNRQRTALNKKSELAFNYASSRDSEDAEEAEKVVATSEFARVVESIGTDFEPLKLPKNYDVMVGEYANWTTRATAVEGGPTDLQEAYRKFLADPEFAKKVGPLPEGHETLFIYMNAEAARQAQGGTLKGHVLALAHDAGVFKKMRASDRDVAARALAAKSDKALHLRGTEPRPASVNAGTGDAPEGPVIPRDVESARKFLAQQQKKHAAGGYRPTEDDMKNERLAREWVLSGGKESPVMDSVF